MEKKEEKKRIVALKINDDFDFKFAKKMPKVLRWILVVPTGIVSLLLIQLSYGFIVNMLLKYFAETSVVMIIVNAIFSFIKFYIFLISMVAMAPVTAAKKFKTGVGLSIVPLSITGGIIILAMILTPDYTYSVTEIISQIVAVVTVVLALVVGLVYIKMETNKEKDVIVEPDNVYEHDV